MLQVRERVSIYSVGGTLILGSLEHATDLPTSVVAAKLAQRNLSPTCCDLDWASNPRAPHVSAALLERVRANGRPPARGQHLGRCSASAGWPAGNCWARNRLSLLFLRCTPVVMRLGLLLCCALPAAPVDGPWLSPAAGREMQLVAGR